MTSAEERSSEEQIAKLLGREALDRLKQQNVLQPFAGLVSLDCDPGQLWDGLVAIRLAWDEESPKREERRVQGILPPLPGAPSCRSEYPPNPKHEVVAVPPNTFEGEIGFDRSELETVIKRLRQCAVDLKRLKMRRVRDILREKYRFPQLSGRWFPPLEGRPTLSDVLSELEQLPGYQEELPWRLLTLAFATEEAASHVSVGARPLYDHAVASLIAYVLRTTGASHDPEVSALIEAARGTPYDAEAHRHWRERHSSLLS